MSLTVAFRKVAQREFDSATAWYENQRAGLGNEFVSEIQRVLDTITAHPDRYPVVFGTIREALVSRFPYAIYYRVKPERIVVVAVFHASRDPLIWQRRK
jgi:plasmid stabilization system protein ParE